MPGRKMLRSRHFWYDFHVFHCKVVQNLKTSWTSVVTFWHSHSNYTVERATDLSCFFPPIKLGRKLAFECDHSIPHSHSKINCGTCHWSNSCFFAPMKLGRKLVFKCDHFVPRVASIGGTFSYLLALWTGDFPYLVEPCYGSMYYENCQNILYLYEKRNYHSYSLIGFLDFQNH